MAFDLDHSDLWRDTGVDWEGEHIADLVTAARQAGASEVWPFLSEAGGHQEFEHRRAMMSEGLDRCARKATEQAPEHYLAVRTALDEAYILDFQATYDARLAAEQAQNAPRAAQRAQERQAAGSTKECPTCKGRGFTEHQRAQRKNWEEAPNPSSEPKCPHCDGKGWVKTAQRRQASIIEMHAWADSFGNWHARVITDGSVGAEDEAQAAALAKIRSELAAREGSGFASEVVGITLNHRDSEGQWLTFYYDETNAHEGSRRTAAGPLGDWSQTTGAPENPDYEAWVLYTNEKGIEGWIYHHSDNASQDTDSPAPDSWSWHWEVVNTNLGYRNSMSNMTVADGYANDFADAKAKAEAALAGIDVPVQQNMFGSRKRARRLTAQFEGVQWNESGDASGVFTARGSWVRDGYTFRVTYNEPHWNMVVSTPDGGTAYFQGECEPEDALDDWKYDAEDFLSDPNYHLGSRKQASDRTWPCKRCGNTVYSYGGGYDTECTRCHAQYNAFGQMLRDDWAGNSSNYDDDVSDMEGYERQHAHDGSRRTASDLNVSTCTVCKHPIHQPASGGEWTHTHNADGDHRPVPKFGSIKRAYSDGTCNECQGNGNVRGEECTACDGTGKESWWRFEHPKTSSLDQRFAALMSKQAVQWTKSGDTTSSAITKGRDSATGGSMYSVQGHVTKSGDSYSWRTEITGDNGAHANLASSGTASSEAQAISDCEVALGRALSMTTATRKTAEGETRSLSDIAWEIRRDWGLKTYFGAVPYIDAMLSLDKITDRYGAEDASSIVSYFLGNAGSWRGETAKRVKAELKAMLKGRYGSKIAAEWHADESSGSWGGRWSGADFGDYSATVVDWSQAKHPGLSGAEWRVRKNRSDSMAPPAAYGRAATVEEAKRNAEEAVMWLVEGNYDAKSASRKTAVEWHMPYEGEPRSSSVERGGGGRYTVQGFIDFDPSIKGHRWWTEVWPKPQYAALEQKGTAASPGEAMRQAEQAIGEALNHAILSSKTAASTGTFCHHCGKPMDSDDPGYDPSWGEVQIHDHCLGPANEAREGRELANHQKWWDAMDPEFRKGYEDQGFSRDKYRLGAKQVHTAGSGGVENDQRDQYRWCDKCNGKTLRDAKGKCQALTHRNQANGSKTAGVPPFVKKDDKTKDPDDPAAAADPAAPADPSDPQDPNADPAAQEFVDAGAGTPASDIAVGDVVLESGSGETQVRTYEITEVTPEDGGTVLLHVVSDTDEFDARVPVDQTFQVHPKGGKSDTPKEEAGKDPVEPDAKDPADKKANPFEKKSGYDGDRRREDLSGYCASGDHHRCEDYADTTCCCECHDHHGTPYPYSSHPYSAEQRRRRGSRTVEAAGVPTMVNFTVPGDGDPWEYLNATFGSVSARSVEPAGQGAWRAVLNLPESVSATAQQALSENWNNWSPAPEQLQLAAERKRANDYLTNNPYMTTPAPKPGKPSTPPSPSTNPAVVQPLGPDQSDPTQQVEDDPTKPQPSQPAMAVLRETVEPVRYASKGGYDLHVVQSAPVIVQVPR